MKYDRSMLHRVEAVIVGGAVLVLLLGYLVSKVL